MSPLALSSAIFALTLGGIAFGALLRRALPEHHLSKDSQDVVRLGAGLIATIAALVLGLLIAAAKGSFDTQSTQVKQIVADIILLDNLLAQYGPEAGPIREQMRGIIDPFADRLWQEKEANTAGRFEVSAAGEKNLSGNTKLVAAERSSTITAGPRRTNQHRSGPNPSFAVRGIGQSDSDAISSDSSFLADYHIRKLQPVL